MPIRLSGMNSGLDTEALVRDLVSAYSMKKDKVVKQQKRHQWTMDAWKDVNSKVYSFYTSNLSSMRYSSSYQLKKASISNSKVATVTATNNSVVGTQSLSVSQLASSGYLTGGVISAKDAEGKDIKITANTKLSELGITDGSLKINGTTVELKGDTTLDTLARQMKSAGVNANFDADNGRFFLSATTSGAKRDFSITAGDSSGINALKKLGLFTTKDSNGGESLDVAKYREVAAWDKDAVIESRYNKQAYTEESFKKKLNGEIESATKSLESVNKSIEEMEKDDYVVTDHFKNNEEYEAKLNELKAKRDEYQQKIDNNTDILNNRFEEVLNDENSKIRQNISIQVQNEIIAAKTVLADIDAGNSTGAVRIAGRDSRITLNGAEFTSNTNSFSINGLNIDINALTTSTTKDENGNDIVVDEPVTINVASDSQGIYDKIKNFLKGYNELVQNLDSLYYAADAKGYEPLTDDEQKELTDKQVEDWEKKVKDSLLRKDSTLSGITSALRNAMAGTSLEIDGETYTLTTFGISTGSYFSTESKDRNVYHIDGDKDDSITSSNTDKLMTMISKDPDKVIEFFQKLSNEMYDALSSKMASSSVSSAFTIYNDKEMSSQYSDYKDKVSKWEEKLESIQDSYYKKFAAMEKALATLQSQTSALSGLLGGGN